MDYNSNITHLDIFRLHATFWKKQNKTKQNWSTGWKVTRTVNESLRIRPSSLAQGRGEACVCAQARKDEGYRTCHPQIQELPAWWCVPSRYLPVSQTWFFRLLLSGSIRALKWTETNYLRLRRTLGFLSLWKFKVLLEKEINSVPLLLWGKSAK